MTYVIITEALILMFSVALGYASFLQSDWQFADWLPDFPPIPAKFGLAEMHHFKYVWKYKEKLGVFTWLKAWAMHTKLVITKKWS